MNLKKIIKKIIKVNLFNLILIKILFFSSKKSNYFRLNYELNKRKLTLKSYPTFIFLNTTNLCNYRCKFCEIHYFHPFAISKKGKVFPNNVNNDFIEKFRRLFKRCVFIELSGATGEPLLNPYFIEICKKLKEFKIFLNSTTNASLLNTSISKELVEMKFNTIAASIHSGDKDNYQELQGGDLNLIFNNLKTLIEIRNTKNSDLPKIIINCLLFKLNHYTLKNLIKQAKEIGVDSVNIYHYYASRNKLEKDISYFFDYEEGNKILDEIYEFARNIDQKMTPLIPNYINIDSMDKNIKNNCNQPWENIKFKGCVEYEDSHYIGACNRIMLFRLNYKEFKGDFIKDIWNHELFFYFRKTVLHNPICKFCNDVNTPKLRCISNKEYQIKRDKAIEEFFIEASKNIEITPRKGIYLIHKNPYEYKDYYETLKL